MKCPAHALIGWLYDTANGLDWRVSILDILETERRWPGVMEDLAVEAWQRKIVRDQIKGSGKAPDEPSE